MSELKLAIAGEIRSGKSTLAAYAQEHYNMEPFAFADELKKGFHYTYPHIPWDPKPRKGYQLYGQLMRFVYGEDYWINLMFQEIEVGRKAAAGYHTLSSASYGFSPLVTDARQPNEFNRLRKEGYKIIKVSAPVELRKQRAEQEGDKFSEEDLYHETELYIKDLEPDYLIVNDGTVEELYAQFDRVIEYIRYGGISC